ncbi:hypothetical protein RGQ21_08640 [Kitasatospora aureofaciens]|nr:hypothetical protein RGQ21_08640 [Kitasatospora aureofaciens]
MARAEEFPYGLRHHEAAAAAETGYGLAIKVAHAAQPRPGGALASDGRRAVTVAGYGAPVRTSTGSGMFNRMAWLQGPKEVLQWT